MTAKTSLLNNAGSHRNATLPQYERAHADLYTTPAEAVQRLYKARPELRDMHVWDSSAGLGHIVAAIRDMGCLATGTELHDHPFPKMTGIMTGVDLFTVKQRLTNTAIINPPYSAAVQHIRHMLGLGCTVYALLRFNFITARKRAWMLDHLTDIIMVGRQHMPPPGVEDKGMSPTVDYAWFVLQPEKKSSNQVILERA